MTARVQRRTSANLDMARFESAMAEGLSGIELAERFGIHVETARKLRRQLRKAGK